MIIRQDFQLPDEDWTIVTLCCKDYPIRVQVKIDGRWTIVPLVSATECVPRKVN